MSVKASIARSAWIVAALSLAFSFTPLRAAENPQKSAPLHITIPPAGKTKQITSPGSIASITVLDSQLGNASLEDALNPGLADNSPEADAELEASSPTFTMVHSSEIDTAPYRPVVGASPASAGQGLTQAQKIANSIVAPFTTALSAIGDVTDSTRTVIVGIKNQWSDPERAQAFYHEPDAFNAPENTVAENRFTVPERIDEYSPSLIETTKHAAAPVAQPAPAAESMIDLQPAAAPAPVQSAQAAPAPAQPTAPPVKDDTLAFYWPPGQAAANEAALAADASDPAAPAPVVLTPPPTAATPYAAMPQPYPPMQQMAMQAPPQIVYMAPPMPYPYPYPYPYGYAPAYPPYGAPPASAPNATVAPPNALAQVPAPALPATEQATQLAANILPQQSPAQLPLAGAASAERIYETPEPIVNYNRAQVNLSGDERQLARLSPTAGATRAPGTSVFEASVRDVSEKRPSDAISLVSATPADGLDRLESIDISPIHPGELSPSAGGDLSYAVASEPVTNLDNQTRNMLKKIPSNIDKPEEKKIEKITLSKRPQLEGDIEPLPINAKIKTQKNHFDVQYELTRAYEALVSGDSRTAIERYNIVLSHEADNKNALFGVASTYHRLGQLDRARPFYQQLLKIDPTHREALNNFLALAAEEAPQEALKELLYLETRNPDFSAIPAQISTIYQQLGRPQDAVEKLVRAISLSPENLTYRYNLAILFDKLNKYDEASALYQLLIDAEQKGEKLPGEVSRIQERLTYIRSNKS